MMKKQASSPAVSGPRRCVCRKCPGCVDNDRWERIFREKYGQQERDYYAAASQPRSSGVSAQAFAEASIHTCAEQREMRKSEMSQTNRKRLHNLLHDTGFTQTAA